MIRIFNFLMFSLFISNFNSQEMIYRQEMIHSPNLFELKKVESFPYYSQNQEMTFPSELNLNFLDGIIINTDFSFSEAVNSCILYHGKRKIYSKEVIILSEQIPVDMNPNNGGKWYGYLVIINKEDLLLAKIFEQSFDSPEFQKSFLFEDYLITMKFIDHGYDLVVEDEIKEIKIYFQVGRINKNGIKILNEKEGTQIAQKYKPEYFNQ